MEVPLVPGDAFTQIDNPGILGLESLEDRASAGYLLPMSFWEPGFSLKKNSYDCAAAEYSVDLSSALHAPFPVSAGFGFAFARLRIDSEAFYVGGPNYDIYPSTLEDVSQSYLLSFGVGKDVRAGIGIKLNHFNSSIGYFDQRNIVYFENPGDQEGAWTTDIGIAGELPLDWMLPGCLNHSNMEVCPSLKLDIGYFQTNIGNCRTQYFGVVNRTAALGIALSAGLSASVDSLPWSIFSVTLLRQADNYVHRYNVTLDTLGDIVALAAYDDLLGHFQPIKNLVLGQWGGLDVLRAGIEVGVGECLYGRVGSIDSEFLTAKTAGFGIRIDGLMTALIATGVVSQSSGLVRYIHQHVDVRYDRGIEIRTDPDIFRVAYDGVSLTLK